MWNIKKELCTFLYWITDNLVPCDKEYEFRKTLFVVLYPGFHFHTFLKKNILLILGVVQIFREKDETKKNEMTKTFQTEGIPNALKMFEKLLSSNGGKFFVGNEVGIT